MMQYGRRDTYPDTKVSKRNGRSGKRFRQLWVEWLEPRRLLAGVNFDPDGDPNTANDIPNLVAFDWAVGNMYGEGFNDVIVQYSAADNGDDGANNNSVPDGAGGATVRTLYQSFLASFSTDGMGIALVPPGTELTIVVSYPEIVTNFDPAMQRVDLGLGTSPAIPNFVEIYFDATPDQNNLNRTGFNDGQLILRGQVQSAMSTFTLSTNAVSLLDEVGNDYPSVQSIAGIGIRNVEYSVDWFDPMFFTDLPVINGTLTSTLESPYDSVDPSNAFVTSANADNNPVDGIGSGPAPSTTNAAGQDRVGDGIPGVGVGRVNLHRDGIALADPPNVTPDDVFGFGGPDAIFEADANNSLEFSAAKSGRKFHDLNGDGDDEGGAEPGLMSWEIRAYADNGDGILNQTEFNAGPFDTTATDMNGNYTLILDPGQYIVVELLQSGWFQSFPSDSPVLDGGLSTPGMVLGANGYAITLESGEEELSNDFGNFQQATKTGRKFHDLNGDGDDEGGNDPGLVEWEIRAYRDNNPQNGMLDQAEFSILADSDTTDANGNYVLNLDPGNYVVVEVQQNGWTQSFPSNAPVVNGLDTGNTTLGSRGYAISLVSQQLDTGNNFGNFLQATKTGRKFHDLNGDGDDEGGSDPGLAESEIRAYADDGDGILEQTEFNAPPAATDTTDANGNYSLDLTPGNYVVVEVLQSGWLQSSPASAPVLAGNLNAGGIALGSRGYSISLDSQQTDEGNDFGNFQQATKTGRKFHDLNGDGDDEGGTEPGLAGWEIRAYRDSNPQDGMLDQAEFAAVPVDTDTTDAHGIYTLALDPGNYIVVEVLQNNWTQSFPTSAPVFSGLATGGTTLGSRGYAVSLASQQQDTGNDFGNFQQATKTGRKFHDLNGDGDDEGGNDPGLAGWEIRAYRDNNPQNGMLDQAEFAAPLAAMDTTDSNGNYSLLLAPGNYVVVEVLQNGWTQSFPSSAPVFDGLDTGGVILGSRGHVISLASQQQDAGNNFGNFQQATKTGRKFHDLNQDGDDEGGAEPGLAGWEIRAYRDNNPQNGILDQAEFAQVPADTDTTDANGTYTLDLDPGNYVVVEVQQNGWTQSFPTSAPVLNGLDTGGISLGSRGYVIDLASQQQDAGNDFGNFQQAAKTGRKFHDLNGDGDDEGGTDPGLQGWTIRAYADDGDGILEQAEFNGGPVAEDTTAANGSYSLELAPGDYVVVELLQSGWLQSSPVGAPVLAGNLNTGSLTLGSRGYPVSLASQESDEGNDFGNIVPGSIHGFKFEDVDGSGTFDPALQFDRPFDPQKFPVQFELTGDTDGDGDQDTVTATIDDTGQFSFENLWPGPYVLRELTGAFSNDIMPSPQRDPLMLVVDSTEELVWQSGAAMLDPADLQRQVLIDADGNGRNDDLVFGNLVKASVHGFKFEDTDADGVYEPEAGEGPFNPADFAIQFDLTGDTDGDGNVETLTTTIDGTGQFWFENLWPGIYVIQERNDLFSTDIMSTTPAGVEFGLLSAQEAVWQQGAAMLQPGDPQEEILVDGDVVNGRSEFLMFGNVIKGSIHGFYFNDFDANADFEPAAGEVPFESDVFLAEIQLTGDVDGDGNPDMLSTTIDQNGAFWFEDLWPGDYTLTAITAPFPSGILPTTEPTRTVTVGAREEIVWRTGAAMLAPGARQREVLNDADGDGFNDNLTFGVVVLGSIHGFKFEDFDGDGIYEPNDPLNPEGSFPRPASITLTGDVDGDGTTETIMASTDALGEFAFLNLSPGIYTMDEAMNGSDDVMSSTPLPVTVTVGSMQELVWQAGAAILQPGAPQVEVLIDLDGNGRNDALVLGNLVTGSIHGFKFEDRDGDGVYEPNDPMFPEGPYTRTTVAVELSGDIDGNGTVESESVTLDANGEFGFVNLWPGTYTIRELPDALPPGTVSSTPTTVTVTVGSRQELVWRAGAAMLDTGDMRQEVLLDPDQNGLNDNLILGNVLTGSIHGFKFEDRDGDGVYEPNDNLSPEGPFDPAKFPVRFELIGDSDGDGGNDTILAMIDASGQFQFVNLFPGNYTLREVTEELPADIMPSPVREPLTIVVNGGEELVWQQGAAMLPPGAVQTEVVVGDQLVFGNVVKGAIHGFKFEDRDGDGVYEPDDPLFPEGPFDPAKFPVRFELSGDVDGDGDQDTVFATIGANGQFDFENLWPGDYLLREVVEELPADVIPLRPPEILAISVRSMEEIVWQAGAAMLAPGDPQVEVLSDLDGNGRTDFLVFGNLVLGSVHGFKFEDFDGDGAYEPESGEGPFDPTIASVLFELTGDVDGDGVQDTVLATPDANGEFGFTGLWPGQYLLREVVEELPPDVMPSLPPETLAFFIGSMDELVWQPGAAMLLPGAPQREVLNDPDGNGRNDFLAFGNVVKGSIHGFKYEDRNGNGIYEPNDPTRPETPWDINIFPAHVELTGDVDGDGIQDTLTQAVNANSEFAFGNLFPGIYQLREVVEEFPADVMSSTPGPFALLVGSRQELAWRSGAAMLPQGALQTEVVFDPDGNGFDDLLTLGNVVKSSVHGFKFEDLDGDGIFEPGDLEMPEAPWSPSLFPVQFQLAGDHDGDGSVEGVNTVSDANGHFWYRDLFPGLYTLREVTEGLPANVLPTTPIEFDLFVGSREELAWQSGAAMLDRVTNEVEIVDPALAVGFGNRVIELGELTWTKIDMTGNPLPNSTFVVTQTQSFDLITGTLNDVPDVPITVFDNFLPDMDPAPGAFRLVDVIFGTYTLEETSPPPRYDRDPFIDTVFISPNNPFAMANHVWVNNWSMRSFLGSTLGNVDAIVAQRTAGLVPTPTNHVAQIGVALGVSAANRFVDVNQPSVSDAEQMNADAGHARVARPTADEADRFFQLFS